MSIPTFSVRGFVHTDAQSYQLAEENGQHATVAYLEGLPGSEKKQSSRVPSEISNIQSRLQQTTLANLQRGIFIFQDRDQRAAYESAEAEKLNFLSPEQCGQRCSVHDHVFDDNPFLPLMD